MSIYEFDEEKYRQGLLEEGREEGMNLGKELGRQEGREEGLQEGLQEGRQEGREKGIQEGEERVNKLNLRLLAEKRYEDLERASKDKKYQQELFELYHI